MCVLFGSITFRCNFFTELFSFFRAGETMSGTPSKCNGSSKDSRGIPVLDLQSTVDDVFHTTAQDYGHP